MASPSRLILKPLTKRHRLCSTSPPFLSKTSASRSVLLLFSNTVT
ncbi:hypothetical protein CCACVL1_12878 [Corchorus capsularis]|uniref:Uncharacterized protein n=1 Tax=Corchorus capsularis TaxID=210143 RepID=A0A1R3IDA8_COCAP|nr:hypothetical protein CCACVL1_12878 [Corchorus capsularis]